MTALLIVGIAFLACVPYRSIVFNMAAICDRIHRSQRLYQGGSLRRYIQATRYYVTAYILLLDPRRAALGGAIVVVLSTFGLACDYVRLSVEWRWEQWLVFCVVINSLTVLLYYIVSHRRAVTLRLKDRLLNKVAEYFGNGFAVVSLVILFALYVGSYRREFGPLDGSEPRITETVVVATCTPVGTSKTKFVLVSTEGNHYLVSVEPHRAEVLPNDRVTLTYWVNRDPNVLHPYRYVTDFYHLESAN